MDVAAVLLLGVAKADGDITSDQKRELLAMFQGEFDLTRDAAADLLLAMMRRVAALDGDTNGEQRKLIDAAESFFAARHQPAGKWN